MRYLVNIFFFATALCAQEANSLMLTGANALYWEERDTMRMQPDYLETLKKLHIQTMRFPGGEVANVYDWRTNTLTNPKRWPYSKKASDAIDRMDFNEFMQLQKRLGSEPLIVVNLANGFVTGDLEEAANIAAEWVRYANIEMGYGVKYWEIGNEAYLMQTLYPLSAKEYAKAFNLFAKKMKAVDPNIEIGAIGPFDTNGVALYDRLTAKNKQKVQKIKNGKKRKEIAKKLLKKQKKIRAIRWWNMVLENCKDNIDFIALHHYIAVRKTNNDMGKSLNIKKRLSKMSVLTRRKIGRKLPIFITEWNISKNCKLSAQNFRKTLLEAEKEFLESGVKAIYFWPLRSTGKARSRQMINLL